MDKVKSEGQNLHISTAITNSLWFSLATTFHEQCFRLVSWAEILSTSLKSFILESNENDPLSRYLHIFIEFVTILLQMFMFGCLASRHVVEQFSPNQKSTYTLSVGGWNATTGSGEVLLHILDATAFCTVGMEFHTWVTRLDQRNQ